MSLLGAPTADLSPLGSKMLIQVIEREPQLSKFFL